MSVSRHIPRSGYTNSWPSSGIWVVERSRDAKRSSIEDTANRRRANTPNQPKLLEKIISYSDIILFLH